MPNVRPAMRRRYSVMRLRTAALVTRTTTPMTIGFPIIARCATHLLTGRIGVSTTTRKLHSLSTAHIAPLAAIPVTGSPLTSRQDWAADAAIATQATTSITESSARTADDVIQATRSRRFNRYDDYPSQHPVRHPVALHFSSRTGIFRSLQHGFRARRRSPECEL